MFDSSKTVVILVPGIEIRTKKIFGYDYKYLKLKKKKREKYLLVMINYHLVFFGNRYLYPNFSHHKLFII